MSVLNNSLFRIFRDVVYCLIIKVLCRFRDSHVIISHLLSLVNNFFKFIFAVLFDLFVSRDSFVRITPLEIKVNTFFDLFFLCEFSTIGQHFIARFKYFSTISNLMHP